MDFPADTSYDELVIRYENAKQLIHEITETFRSNSRNLERVINEYANDSNSSFVTALKAEITKIGTSMQSLFANAKDPGLYKPTKLQEQITNYETEKALGYKQLSEMKKELFTLKEEKKNWNIREQKGKKMIQECQSEIERLKNNNSDDNNDNTNNYDDNNNMINDNENTSHEHVNELTNELELAQRSAADLREMVDQLTSENKSLSHQVLSLREETLRIDTAELTAQIQTLTAEREKYFSEVTELRAVCAEYRRKLEKRGVSSKHLYRNDTMTSWDDSNLDDLKGDMLAEFQKLAHDNLAKQSDAQMELRFNEQAGAIINEDAEQEYAPNNNKNPNANEEEDANKVYRSDTLTEWDQEKLNEMTSEMKRELQELVSEDKKSKIFNMTENQLLVHDDDDEKDGNTIGSGNPDNNNFALLKNEKEAMQAKFLAMKQQGLISAIEKNYDLVTAEQDGFNNKMTVKAEDSEEIRRQISAMRKDALEKQSQVEYTEPQIRQEHIYQFDDLMKSIGIINDNIVHNLWKHILFTVHPSDSDNDEEDDDSDSDNEDDGKYAIEEAQKAKNDLEREMEMRLKNAKNDLKEMKDKFDMVIKSKSTLAQQCATEIMRLSMVINALLQLPNIKDTVQLLIEESYKV